MLICVQILCRNMTDGVVFYPTMPSIQPMYAYLHPIICVGDFSLKIPNDSLKILNKAEHKNRFFKNLFSVYLKLTDKLPFFFVQGIQQIQFSEI